MLSIIISSANPALLKNVQQNIKDTVGVPYEIIIFDNSKGVNGLCKLYNEGTHKAKFDTLCFMHEDVEIKTINWGKKVIDYFDKDPQLGLIGLAGSSYKSAIPSGWHDVDITSCLNYVNIIQAYKRQPRGDVYLHSNPKHEKLSRVVCVDGVWLCTPKHVALQYPFDEKLLQGFHVYDIDFSLAVNQEYKVAVTFEILLKHFSEGDYNFSWFKDIIKIHKKWNYVLPINLEGLSSERAAVVEKKKFRSFIRDYHKFLTITESMRILYQSKIYKLNFFTYLKLYSSIVKRHTKKLFT